MNDANGMRHTRDRLNMKLYDRPRVEYKKTWDSSWKSVCWAVVLRRLPRPVCGGSAYSMLPSYNQVVATIRDRSGGVTNTQ